MNETKETEEMYQEFLQYKHDTLCEVFSYKGMCKNFIELGYRKINKDKVVLDKEAFWKLSNKFSKKELDEITEFHKNKASKETAKDIIQEIKDSMKCFEDDDDGYLLKKCEFEYFMREIAKKYRVEVE